MCEKYQIRDESCKRCHVLNTIGSTFYAYGYNKIIVTIVARVTHLQQEDAVCRVPTCDLVIGESILSSDGSTIIFCVR